MSNDYMGKIRIPGAKLRKQSCEDIPCPEHDHIFKIDWDKVRLRQWSEIQGYPKVHGTVVNEDIWGQWEQNFYEEFPKFKGINDYLKKQIYSGMCMAQSYSQPNMKKGFFPPNDCGLHHFICGLRWTLIFGKPNPPLLSDADRAFWQWFMIWDLHFVHETLRIRRGKNPVKN